MLKKERFEQWESNNKIKIKKRIERAFTAEVESKKEIYQVVQKEKKNPFRVSTPYMLKYTDESLFTKEFMSNVKAIIGEGSAFKKKSIQERKQISDELSELFDLETVWKHVVKKSQHSSRIVKELFSEGVYQFVSEYENGFFPSEDDKKNVRSQKKRGMYKCVLFLMSFLSYMVKNIEKFPFLLTNYEYTEISEEEIRKIVNTMKPEELFCELVKISMKKAYEMGINIEHKDSKSFFNQELGSDCLQAKRTDLHYPISEYITLHLLALLLNELARRKALKNTSLEAQLEYLKIINRHIKSSMEHHGFYTSEENRWFGLKDEIAYLLLIFFEQTEVVVETNKQQKKIQNGLEAEVYVYTFNRKLDNSLAFSETLPRIIPPLKAESEQCVVDWVTPVKGGEMTVKASKKAIEALNIQQRKEFKVNSNFLSVLMQAECLNEVSEMPTKKVYEAKYLEYRTWLESSWFNALNLHLYNGTKQAIRLAEKSTVNKKKLEKKKISHSEIVQMCSMSYGECHIASKKYEKHHQLATIKAKRQMINTTIQIGIEFSEFPLYFSTKLDFRFRMYPLQYLLSRTSGFLKHILQDYTPRALTSNGLKNLMEAYFAFDLQLTEKVSKITFEKHTKKQLKAFFDNNRFKEIEKCPMYFAMLDKELEMIFTSSEKTPKTGVSIEIDQVGSGPMLVAIITGNTKLAEKCNLLGGAKQCVYTYIMEQTEFFLKETYFELVQNAPEAFEFLKTNRKAQKAALMCYMYNQKHLNRTEEFKKKFEEQKERSIEEAEYQLISKFSVSYDSFIGIIFPMLDVQLNLLEEAMLVLTEQDAGVEITTLDGCILKWDFCHIEKIKRSCWNPILRKPDKFSMNKIAKTQTKETKRQRVGRHRRSFRPNLVHSIDGALMRLFILEHYKRTGHRINHLHDCVLVHPNDVDDIYDVIRDVYCSPAMKTLAKDLVFSRFKQNTTGKYFEKIEAIEKIYTSNMESLGYLNKETFDPRKCYKFEGAK